MACGNVTIEDVAKAAGVSRQTVSRVINRQPRVSARARDGVHEAIRELGYVPSLAARRMGGARSHTLLALVDARAVASLALGETLLAGVETCSQAGYHLMFERIETGLPDAELHARVVGLVGAIAPDGVIVLAPLDEDRRLAEALSKAGVRSATPGEIVRSGRRAGGIDEAHFCEAAARRLVELGHRQVGFVAGRGSASQSRRRLDGYRRVLAEAGSRAHRHFVSEAALDYGGALALARSWLTPTIRPTAIIAETAEIAEAFTRIASDLGVSIPRELSLISLSDSAALAGTQPPVSVLHRNWGDLVAQSCTRLIAASEGKKTDSEPQTYEFIERQSLARAPRAV